MNLPAVSQDTADMGIAPLIALGLGLGIPAVLGATYVGYKAIVPAAQTVAQNVTKPVNQVIYIGAALAALYLYLKVQKKGRA